MTRPHGAEHTFCFHVLQTRATKCGGGGSDGGRGDSPARFTPAPVNLLNRSGGGRKEAVDVRKQPRIEREDLCFAHFYLPSLQKRLKNTQSR